MASRGRFDADDQLAALLASGLPIKAAAEKAHVSERTAHRRLEDPAFVARVEELRTRLVSDALGKLEGAMSGAADALRELVGHDDPHVRIRAACEILKNALRVKEHTELADRLAKLEAQITQEGTES